MNNSNPGSEEMLRKELGALGAREFEYAALCMDSDRGLAALNYAIAKGANNPIPYAIKLFDDETWSPAGEVRRRATNVHVSKDCAHCNGHRFVLVTDGLGPYEETWAPCVQCNAKADTGFWAAGGERRVAVPL